MAIKKRPVSPRQRMINLMYIVLLAMLALNVSTEVLHGFSVVEEGLSRTTNNATAHNNAIYNDFHQRMKANPAKVNVWFEKATMVKDMSDKLFDYVESLKVAIVKEADGEDGDVKNIEHTDNLDAAGVVMLSPIKGQGKRLYHDINAYRRFIVGYVSDPRQRAIIENNLSTAVPQNQNGIGKNWQEYMFEDMPVAAAITLLSKLQNDIRQAEGTVLHDLIANVDLKDIRVNKLSAFVVPERTTLYPGERFDANIVMAAIDTTQQPDIYVNGSRVQLSQGRYSFNVGGVGEHTFSGYILMRNAQGGTVRRDFKQSYNVIPVPGGATVASDLMNVLYAGYRNPISVSVPGIPQNAVSVSMTGGQLVSASPGRYVAIPTTVGHDVTFQVTARDGKQTRSFPPFTFKVRRLPDPTPYLAVETDRFKGGNLYKASLMGVKRLDAAMDDGILDIPFKVTGFSTVFYDNMGNAVQMSSTSSDFTERMREQFSRLSRGRRFYITEIKAIGPDGITRTLPGAMEIRLR